MSRHRRPRNGGRSKNERNNGKAVSCMRRSGSRDRNDSCDGNGVHGRKRHRSRDGNGANLRKTTGAETNIYDVPITGTSVPSTTSATADHLHRRTLLRTEPHDPQRILPKAAALKAVQAAQRGWALELYEGAS